MSEGSAPSGIPRRRASRAAASAMIAAMLVIAAAACDSGQTDDAEPAVDDVIAANEPTSPAVEAEPITPSIEADPIAPSAAPSPAVADPDARPEPEPSAPEPAEAAPALDPEPIAEPQDAAVPLAAENLTDDDEILTRLATADIDEGWRVGQRCAACHSIAIDPPAGVDRLGPPLANVVRNLVASTESFDYSAALVGLREAGITWNIARLDAFIADPRAAVPGTTMTMTGIADPQDRIDVIAFLVDLADRSVAAAMGIGTTPGADGKTIAERIEQANPAAGEALASARCGACHLFSETGTALAGPNLFDIVGRPVGADPQYGYSAALRALNAAGGVWTLTLLDAFLQSPSIAIPGTRMGFTGVASATDRENIIAYLRLLADEPLALAAAGVGIPRPGFEPATFTVEQATLGGEYFELYDCAGCHGADLRGRVDIGGLGDAPTLTGPNFERRWYAGPVDALFNYILTRKDIPAGVAADHSAAIVAYILRQNGFRSSGTPLPADDAALETIGFFQ